MKKVILASIAVVLIFLAVSCMKAPVPNPKTSQIDVLDSPESVTVLESKNDPDLNIDVSFYVDRLPDPDSEFVEVVADWWENGERQTQTVVSSFIIDDISSAEEGSLIPFVLVPRSSVDKHEKIHEAIIISQSEKRDILSNMISEKTSLDGSLVMNQIIESRHVYKLDNDFFSGWSEDEKKQFLSDRYSEEVITIIDDILQSVEYRERLAKRFEELGLCQYFTMDAETISDHYSGEVLDMLEKCGCIVIHTITDPDWEATLSYVGSPCVALCSSEKFDQLRLISARDYYICRIPEYPFSVQK